MADEQDAKVLLAEKLFSDPESRAVMQELIAKKFPTATAAMPDYLARKTVEAELSKDREDRAKERAEREEYRREKARDTERKKILTMGLASDEEIPAIEKLMDDELIGSHEVAAREFRRRNMPVAAPRSDSRSMRVPGVKGAGGDEFKGIVEDTEQWARDRAEEIMNDFAAGKGAKWMA